MSFSGENKDNKKLDLIKPSNNLKFEVKKDTCRTSISFELGKVHEKKSYSVVSITFLILVCCVQRKIKQLVKSVKC